MGTALVTGDCVTRSGDADVVADVVDDPEKETPTKPRTPRSAAVKGSASDAAAVPVPASPPPGTAGAPLDAKHNKNR